MNMKKLLAGVLAAAMVVAAVPAGVAEAKATPTNKAVALTFSSESDTDAIFAVLDESTKSEEYALSADVYYPKSAVTEKTAYSIAVNIDVYTSEGEPAAIGSAKVSNTLAGGTAAAANTAVEEIGDYYCFKITSLPVKLSQYAGGSISKYADIPDKVLMFPELKFSGKASTSSKIYVDNLVIKAGSSVAYKNTFDSSQKDSATEIVGSGTEKSLNPSKFSAGKLEVKEKQTVKVGKTINLGAKTEPTGKITYKSSNKKVATVNSKGVVKGIKKGKAKITVTANGLKQVVTVTVK